MEFAVLASGSAGNSLLVRGAGGALLVDAGLSCRQLEARLAAAETEPAMLAGILLTHEHADHAAALRVFLRKWRTPCYCNAATARALPDGTLDGADVRIFQTGAAFAVAGFTALAFSVPHDAADPVGFRIEEGGLALAVLTDLGFGTRLVCEAARGVHALVLESNYDEELLQKDTRRPWSIKQRIASRHGHLSNVEAAELAARIEAPALRRLVLAHLSRDCNAPELAEAAVAGLLASRSERPEITCARQDTPTPFLAVG
ncbi:MAG: MBL fold metallo-hydrolase [Terrimicrobiaceae bacterium]|nr:MBL fold metallo-hydrolase [Terrimicrobiaceae bacterium]